MSQRDKEKRSLQYASSKERADKHEKMYEPSMLSLPPGAKMFRFKQAKTYRLDILPYRVGEGNPFASEGVLHYERTFFVHNVPTTEGVRRYVCSKKTFKEPCYVCDEKHRAFKAGEISKDVYTSLNDKEQQLFNVIDLDADPNEVLIFQFNHWQFGRVLDEFTRRKPRYEGFFHLKGGFTVEVTIEEGSFDGRTVFAPKLILMEPRDGDYGEDILDKTYCLDELIKKIEYKQMKEIYLQGGEASTEDKEEEEEERPSRNGKKPASASVESDFKTGDTVTYAKEECEVLRIASDGTLTLENEDGEIYRKVKPSDVKKMEDEEEEEEEEEDEEEDSTEDEEDSEEDEDEEEDDDDEDEEDQEEEDSEEDEEEDEEDDDEPVPAKRGKGKPAPAKRGGKRR